MIKPTEYFVCCDGIVISRGFSDLGVAIAYRNELTAEGYTKMTVQEYEIPHLAAAEAARNLASATALAEQRNSLIDFDGRKPPRNRAPKVGRRYRLLRR